MRNVGLVCFLVGFALAPSASAAPDCVLESGGTRLPLHEKTVSLSPPKTAWQVIGLTRKGRELIEKVNASHQQTPWKFLPMTEAIRARGFAAFSEMAKGSTSIYLDKETSLGVLAVFLFHEATHGVDDKLREGISEGVKLSQKNQKERDSIFGAVAMRVNVPEHKVGFRHFRPEDHEALGNLDLAEREHKNRITFASERRAYDAQWEFLQQLYAVNDCVKPFLADEASLGKVVNYRPSDSQIRSRYEN